MLMHAVSVTWTVKPVLSRHSKRRSKLVFKTDYRLMQVKSIAECSEWSILQYFWPSLSYQFFINTFVLSIFEWPLKTGFTVDVPLTFCTLGNFHRFFVVWNFFLNFIFFKQLSDCQTVSNVGSDLVQIVCKGYQQMIKAITSPEII